MALTKEQKERIEQAATVFLEARRPPAEIRHQLDIQYSIDKQSVTIFEVRPMWRHPDKTQNIPIAKTTYVKTQQIWKVYWMRADLKWHGYEPAPEIRSIEEFFKLVAEDKFGCFWG